MSADPDTETYVVLADVSEKTHLYRFSRLSCVSCTPVKQMPSPHCCSYFKREFWLFKDRSKQINTTINNAE